MKSAEKGNALIQVVMAAGMVAIIAAAVSSMLSDQNKEVKALTEKMQIGESTRTLDVAFISPDYCSCLFRGTTLNTGTNVLSAAPANLPTNFTTVPAYPAACTAGATTMIPTAGTAMPGMTMKVQGISVTDINEITPGSGNYTANLRVAFNNTIRVIKPLNKAFGFSVDLGSGTAAARPFLYCSTTTLGLGPTTCPTGMTRIGGAGLRSTFCIDTSMRSLPVTPQVAMNTCRSTVVDSTFGAGHLCTPLEWATACNSGTVPAMTSGSPEWQSSPNMWNHGDSTWAQTNKGRGCLGASAAWDYATANYRCCL